MDYGVRKETFTFFSFSCFHYYRDIWPALVAGSETMEADPKPILSVKGKS